ncbi:unnamed protein product, partial [Schistosoma mattheei]
PIIPKLLLNEELIGTNCTHGHCSHSTIHTIDNYNPHIKIGILFTVKPLVQFLVNPFVGPITNRIPKDRGLPCGTVRSFPQYVSYPLPALVPDFFPLWDLICSLP